MKVAELCQKDPVTVRPSDDLVVAARSMRERHVGFVVVVEPDVVENAFRPTGVITDRDIVVSVVAKEADPRALFVSDVMTAAPVAIAEDESPGAALKAMRKIGVRRLPVVGLRGELVGVISMDDILDALVGELDDAIGAIRSEQMIEQSLRP